MMQVLLRKQKTLEQQYMMAKAEAKRLQGQLAATAHEDTNASVVVGVVGTEGADATSGRNASAAPVPSIDVRVVDLTKKLRRVTAAYNRLRAHSSAKQPEPRRRQSRDDVAADQQQCPSPARQTPRDPDAPDTCRRLVFELFQTDPAANEVTSSGTFRQLRQAQRENRALKCVVKRLQVARNAAHLLK